MMVPVPRRDIQSTRLPLRPLLPIIRNNADIVAKAVQAVANSSQGERKKEMDKALEWRRLVTLVQHRAGRLGQPFGAGECCTSTVTCDKSANLANLVR